MKKLKNTINYIINIVTDTRAEYNRRVTENYNTLIRGSVLDPNNHPSTDYKGK